MPSAANVVITVSTSVIISGSSALVGSSNSITFGSMASDRAIATRCCWPPDSWVGYFSAWSAIPTRSNRAIACVRARFLSILRTLTGANMTFSTMVL